MKVLAILVLALLATAQAERDWSKIFRRDLKVPGVYGHIIPNGQSTRITNGNEAVPHSRPWQVGLFVPVVGGTAFCGGSLIDASTVLTAAHCVDDVAGSIEVVLGAHRIQQAEDTQVVVTTNNYVQHENWDSANVRNDVALIKLPSPVTLNENIQPIALASNPSNNYVGEEANVSGWGLDSDSSTTISPVLREVTIPVITNSECAEYYGSVIQSGHICTDTTGGKSTCNGDSGGPLVNNGEQIGIVSFGVIFGCEVGYPAAFTRVTEYLDWIAQNRN